MFSSDLGADRVFVYRYEPNAHPEHPLIAATPASVQLPPGSGPRHLLFGADGKLVREWRKVRVKGHADAVLEAATAL